MDMNKQMKCQEIVNESANRIVKELINQNKAIYNKKNEISYYKANVKCTRFIKTTDFLSLPNNKEETYNPIIVDITYIISTFYDLCTEQNLTYTLRKLIKENYDNLDANELASFFMPFYDTKNWDILNSADKIETKKFNDFLVEHKKTLNLFTELWRLNIKCFPSDLKLLCTSFYNHNDLPSKEKYQEMLNTYEKCQEMLNAYEK